MAGTCGDNLLQTSYHSSVVEVTILLLLIVITKIGREGLDAQRCSYKNKKCHGYFRQAKIGPLLKVKPRNVVHGCR